MGAEIRHEKWTQSGFFWERVSGNVPVYEIAWERVSGNVPVYEIAWLLNVD